MRVLDKTWFYKPFRFTKISTFAFSKSRFFMFSKHCKALFFSETQIGLPLFFSSKNQNSAKTLNGFIEIPALSLPHVYLFLYFFLVSLYSSIYICYPVLSVSTGSLLLCLWSLFFISLARSQFSVPLLLNLCYRFGLFAWWVTHC